MATKDDILSGVIETGDDRFGTLTVSRGSLTVVQTKVADQVVRAILKASGFPEYTPGTMVALNDGCFNQDIQCIGARNGKYLKLVTLVQR